MAAVGTMSADKPKKNPEDWGSYLPHLRELRLRMLKTCALFGVIFLCLIPFLEPIFTALVLPLSEALPRSGQIQSVSVLGGVFVPLKVLGYLSAILCIPFAVYQFWSFLSPGLYRHEKRFIFYLCFLSVFLCFAGIWFVYKIVLAKVFTFIVSFTPKVIQVSPDVKEYVEFIGSLIMGFSIGFQLPMILIGVVGFGIISVDLIKKMRPYVIVSIFFISAFLTPPDVVSQVLLGVPMWLLYEVGVFLSQKIKLHKKEEATAQRTENQ